MEFNWQIVLKSVWTATVVLEKYQSALHFTVDVKQLFEQVIEIGCRFFITKRTRYFVMMSQTTRLQWLGLWLYIACWQQTTWWNCPTSVPLQKLTTLPGPISMTSSVSKRHANYSSGFRFSFYLSCTRIRRIGQPGSGHLLTTNEKLMP